MSTKLANAYPRKHFFLEMFTRDISLEDCILDLIDNSLDGVIRTDQVEYTKLLEPFTKNGNLRKIAVGFDADHFEITDNSGGIDIKDAIRDVFNFGHGRDHQTAALGVYGIGLKRAIFKIGQVFKLSSRTTESGFDVNLNVRDWSEKDDSIDDWRIPITPTKASPTKADAGTVIQITKLRDEVQMRLADGTLEERLRTIISKTYGLFIDRYVQIFLNGKAVPPFQIPIGNSKEITPAHDEFQEDGVHVRLFASLAARDSNGEWRTEVAGWYALCNGRIVVAADKTDLTGWGGGSLPGFHSSKFRGFVGVAFFESKNALALPWTTTKRGLNRESRIYQSARNRMMGVARPIISFLDGLYKPDAPEETFGRTIADKVQQTSLTTMARSPTAAFHVSMPTRRIKTSVRVQYDAELSDIARIKKVLKKPSWGAGAVGKHTFDHFLRTECPE